MCNLFMFLSFFHGLTDLIPVSSTVIPLISYQVNSTGEAKHHSIPLSEEYRIAFLKYLRKRINQEADDPDTLITCELFKNELHFFFYTI